MFLFCRLTCKLIRDLLAAADSTLSGNVFGSTLAVTSCGEEAPDSLRMAFFLVDLELRKKVKYYLTSREILFVFFFLVRLPLIWLSRTSF